MRSVKSRVVLYLLFIAVFFLPVYVFLEELNEKRSEFHLASASSLEGAPPELVLATTVLGGFRGIAVDYLWIRAIELQRSGKYFELVQLYDWIGKMEPRMEMVWAHNAWNMAYNISVELSSPEERWIWIKHGIELLRDEGLKYNPRSSMLYRELAWIYLHKIAQSSDTFHWYYKMKLFEEVEEVLGRNCSLLSSITTDSKLAERLREELRFEPERMLKLMELYGPLDWRLAQSHAIYWLTRGGEVSGQSFLNQDRMILHAVISLCESGRFVKTKAGFLLAEPDFRFLDTADRIYAELGEKYGSEEGVFSGLASAHENFLQSAVMLLYTYGENKQALEYYRRLRRLKPHHYRLPLEDYIFARIRENISEASPNEVSALIHGTLRQSLMSLAVGDDEKSAGLENLAKLIWKKYMERYGDNENFRLPPFEVMRNSVVERALKGEFPQNLLDHLRKRLGYAGETSE